MFLLLRSLFPFAKRLIIAAAQLFVLAILGWHILRFYPGDRWLPVRLGSYFAPWLLLGLLPALGIAWLGRRRWLMVLTIIALLGLAGRYHYLFIPQPRPAIAETPAESLKVMTFNVHYANRNAEGIAGLIQAEKPDIIALQEVTFELGGLLQPELAADYPYVLTENMGGFGLAIASRYPLTEAARPPGAERTLRATVHTPQSVIDLWNIHPGVALSLPRWQAQQQIFEAVSREVAGQTGPVIVLGDFNTTDQAENYALLADHLLDVHQAVGRGLGFTFPDAAPFSRSLPWHLQPLRLLGPVVRIDHIMVSPHFTAQEIYVIPESLGSDHRPVVATLQLKREPAR